jgi:membrane-bound serine protease (ClpP class)
MKPWLFSLAAVLAAVLACDPATGARAANVGRIKIDGPIGPATAGYIDRALSLADARGDACLVIQLDTPGGLLDSTKTIVQSFYQAPIPTVVYVAPSGASATSAGCFIAMAAGVAAMAPNTSIGAAHPVLGFGASEKLDDVMKQKLENFASSSIEAIAQKRGRNAQWAKSAVRESASVTAEEALELKVVDLIATDMRDLLKQLDGRTVDGKVLRTAGATVVDIRMIPREKLFQMLWRPEVMLLLMLAAIYGIIGELSNPGAILPGVAGGIALILLLYMSATLPVNVAGFGLVVLALALFIIDLFAPTHGVLTFGGIVAFFLGAVMLFNGGDPAFRLSLSYIIPATLLTAAFFVFIVGAGVRAQFLPVRAGKEAMVGETTVALQPIDSNGGKVFVEGAYWNAVSDAPAQAGDRVEIVAIDGLTLKVKPTQTAT